VEIEDENGNHPQISQEPAKGSATNHPKRGCRRKRKAPTRPALANQKNWETHEWMASKILKLNWGDQSGREGTSAHLRRASVRVLQSKTTRLEISQLGGRNNKNGQTATTLAISAACRSGVPKKGEMFTQTLPLG